MKIYLNKQDSNPLYLQIYNQIKENIVNHTVPADSPIPSIRQLTKDLQVSMITIKRSYEDLEMDGYIYSIPGKGFYVKEMDQEKLLALNLKLLDEQIVRIKETAEKIGMSVEKLVDYLRESEKKSD